MLYEISGGRSSNVVQESGITDQLLTAAAERRPHAVDDLLAANRAYVRRVVQMRVQPQLQARIDPSDIVQETLVAASRGLDDFLTRRPTSFRVWLRGHALQRLVDAQRRHLSLKRDVRRETEFNEASSMAIVGGIFSNRPSEQLMRRELVDQIGRALTALNAPERDILVMRHGEQLTMAESADALGISTGAASKRYGRAIGRLFSELRKLGVVQD